VAFFPQVLAGPIERASGLLPQIERARSMDLSTLRQGAWLLLWGLFQKAVIADNLAVLVERAYEPDVAVGSGPVLLATYAFAFQIYCDFAGYSNMARGMAKLMGFDLSVNFRLPYLAANPAQFWRRWHITLSQWLRDYLYIPLGGNRCGPARRAFNVMATMLLGGLWHGAAWHFVAWGAFHAVLVAGHPWGGDSATDRSSKPRWNLRRVVSVLLMFHLVCVGWVFFRAHDVAHALLLLGSMVSEFGDWATALEMAPMLVACVGSLLVVEAWIRNADDPAKRPMWNLGFGPFATATLIAMVVLLASGDGAPFIYFQF